ncbi:uncharacterized protein LOC119593875 [Penaeus monodon]|uniref:uncharacterized protein LOC119593875 n=1 Tax=Penaeus monodon TaxID=6687 RepID=UPI0018A7515F|nr:uncharacterized protein LOC119593875 [Penaeus monodon]
MWAGLLPFLVGVVALRGGAATLTTYRRILPTLTFNEIVPATFTSTPDVLLERCVLHCKRSPTCAMVAWQPSPSDCLMYDSLASGLPPTLSTYDVYVAVRDDRLFVLPNSVLWDEAKRICDEHTGRLFPLTDAVAGAAVLAETSLSTVHIGLRKDSSGNWLDAQGEKASSVPTFADSTFDCAFFDVASAFTTLDCATTSAFPLCRLNDR